MSEARTKTRRRCATLTSSSSSCSSSFTARNKAVKPDSDLASLTFALLPAVSLLASCNTCSLTPCERCRDKQVELGNPLQAWTSRRGDTVGAPKLEFLCMFMHAHACMASETGLQTSHIHADTVSELQRVHLLVYVSSTSTDHLLQLTYFRHDLDTSHLARLQG